MKKQDKLQVKTKKLWKKRISTKKGDTCKTEERITYYNNEKKGKTKYNLGNEKWKERRKTEYNLGNEKGNERRKTEYNLGNEKGKERRKSK